MRVSPKQALSPTRWRNYLQVRGKNPSSRILVFGGELTRENGQIRAIRGKASLLPPVYTVYTYDLKVNFPHTEAASRAEEVFDGVIKCKVRADQTRNALTVLQRYRFLFNLPRSIEKNITNVCSCSGIVM